MVWQYVLRFTPQVFLPLTIPIGLVGYWLHSKYRLTHKLDIIDVQQMSTVERRVERQSHGEGIEVGKTIFDR